MKKLLFLTIISVLFIKRQEPQLPEDQAMMVGNWELVKGWFDEGDLEFVKAERKNKPYTFNADKSITRLPLRVNFCAVGVFFLKDGRWSKNDSIVTLEIRGKKVADYWCWYKSEYTIQELSDTLLKLRHVRIIKNKEIKPSSTWEQLINE
jgi:hypothetical protein